MTGPRLRGAGLFRRLRQRYTRASGPRKESLGRELDRAERGARAGVDRCRIGRGARRPAAIC